MKIQIAKFEHLKFADILRYAARYEDFEFRAVQKCVKFVDIEKMLQHEYSEYLLAKIGFDTNDNEPSKIYYLLLCSSPDFGMRITLTISESLLNVIYRPIAI